MKELSFSGEVTKRVSSSQTRNPSSGSNSFILLSSVRHVLTASHILNTFVGESDRRTNISASAHRTPRPMWSPKPVVHTGQRMKLRSAASSAVNVGRFSYCKQTRPGLESTGNPSSESALIRSPTILPTVSQVDDRSFDTSVMI